ncbi:MAG: ArsR/SmtB family transcription factor [Christensenellales bacterium]
MATIYEERARIFKAFCDENRLRILELLQSGEKCACKLLDDLNIQQSTLSHHMKILCDAEIVKGRKDGKWMHYSIDLDGSEYAQETLRHILTINSKEQDSCCD